MIGDLDILVQAPEASPAVEVLQRLGYRIEVEYHPIQHAVGEFVRDSGPGAIDLHVELLDAEYLMPAAPVWTRARAIERDGISFFVPSPTDMILHNLLHTQIHHGTNFYRGVVELRQLYEFATLARRHAAAIDWDEIALRLARYRLGTLLNSYALLADWFCGLTWPLRVAPSRLARAHAAICRLELYWPALRALAGPWANLRFAFAGHRMTDLSPAPIAGRAPAAPCRAVPAQEQCARTGRRNLSAHSKKYGGPERSGPPHCRYVPAARHIRRRPEPGSISD